MFGVDSFHSKNIQDQILYRLRRQKLKRNLQQVDSKKILKVVQFISLSLIALIQVYPLIYLLTFSLKTNLEIFGPDPLALPKKIIWSNYSGVLFDGNLIRYLLNSIVVTSVTVIISSVFAAMAAYAIARMNWKLSGTALTIFLLGVMIPMQATLLPLFLFLKKSGLYNSYWALILPYIGFALPLSIYVLVGFFKTMPFEMEESAFMDGGNIFQIFTKIMLPLIKPAIAIVSIFTYLSCWNELMFAITFISKQQFKTLTVGIMGMVGIYATRWGELGAGLVVGTIPTVIAYILMSGQVEKSIATGGAVKG